MSATSNDIEMFQCKSKYMALCISTHALTLTPGGRRCNTHLIAVNPWESLAAIQSHQIYAHTYSCGFQSFFTCCTNVFL